MERLVIDDVEINDISDLAVLSNLKYFSVIDDSKNDYATILENMDHLEQLSIDTARVSNWAFLGDMKNLNWLSICSTGSRYCLYWRREGKR